MLLPLHHCNLLLCLLAPQNSTTDALPTMTHRNFVTFRLGASEEDPWHNDPVHEVRAEAAAEMKTMTHHGIAELLGHISHYLYVLISRRQPLRVL